MAGATRSSGRKPALRSTSGSQFPAQSSDATISDDTINVVANGHAHRSAATSSRASASRISPTVEPDNLRNGAHDLDSSPYKRTIGREAEPLGADAQDVISVIAKLDNLGLDKSGIRLPQVVLLGEQSAGKSSLIERTTGIKTPRSTDTCTRCPLYINMTPSKDRNDPWMARVYIRINEDLVPKTTARGQTRGYDWKPRQISEIVEFATTDDPDELEILIAHAQLAVLNPLSDTVKLKDFLPSNRPNFKQRFVEFSPNHVGIQIIQPGVAPLSFFDLPGIIGQTEDASTHYLVKYVRDMVTAYVKNPDALVLVTCSLATDIANSNAGNIARIHRAAGRSIGILTKPDLLPPGSREDTLRAVLDGRTYKLGHGYFVVRSLAQDEIDAGLTHEDARLREQNFFKTEHPWCTTFDAYQDRFGAENLQTYLSKQIATQSLRALPGVYQQIEAKIRDVDNELDSIPEPPTHNAVRIISDKLYEFSYNVKREIEGKDSTEWRDQWDNIRKRFAGALTSMKPVLHVSGKLDQGLLATAAVGKSVDDSIVIDSEDEDEGDLSLIETPSKRRKVENTPTVSTPPSAQALNVSRSSMAPPPPTSTPRTSDNAFIHLRPKFRLDEIAAHLQKSSKTKLPGQIRPEVTDTMTVQTLKDWDQPLAELFRQLKAAISSHLLVVFNKSFVQWNESEIYAEAWDTISQVLSCNFEQQEMMAADVLADELDGPYVFDKKLFNDQKATVLESYRTARIAARLRILTNEHDEAAGTGKKMTTAESEKAKGIAVREPYSREIEEMAKVVAYYVVASRRFHDSVCMRIESKFFGLLKSKLHDELDEALKIHDDQHGPEIAARLLQQPEDRRVRRAELLQQRAGLVQGQQHLDELCRKYDYHLQGPSGSSSFGPASTPLTEEMEDVAFSGRMRR